MKIKVLAQVAFATGIITTLGLLGSPAAAESSGDRDKSEPEETRVSLSLAHPLSLQDAVLAAESLDEPVVAFAFATDNVVGEFSFQTGLSVSEYLKFFEENYGTQPEVTALVVVRDTEQQKAENHAPFEATDAGSDLPVFDAPPVVFGGSVAERGAATKATLTQDGFAPRSSGDWRPDATNHGVGLATGVAFFGQQFTWMDFGLDSLPSGIGLEFEINEDNGSVAAPNNVRPLCFDAFHTDRFWAANYGFSWSVTDWHGSTSASALGAYADYNDLTDLCRNNSIAIGLRYPKMLTSTPAPNAFETLDVVILAPFGFESSSLISGNVQAVTESYCTVWPGSTMSLTDCMGVDPIALQWSGYPSGNYNRGTLNISRGWYVPAKCWNTYDHGDTFVDGGCSA